MKHELTRDELSWQRAEHALAELCDTPTPPDVETIALAGVAALNEGRTLGVSENWGACVFVHVDRQGHATPQPLGGGMFANAWRCGASDPERIRANYAKRTQENAVAFLLGDERRLWDAASLTFKRVRQIERYFVRRAQS